MLITRRHWMQKSMQIVTIDDLGHLSLGRTTPANTGTFSNKDSGLENISAAQEASGGGV